MSQTTIPGPAAANATTATSNSVTTLSSVINSFSANPFMTTPFTVSGGRVIAGSLVTADPTDPSKRVELTVLPDDPEHPDRLTIDVQNATPHQINEMCDWLQDEAHGYPRQEVRYHNNTVLTPWFEMGKTVLQTSTKRIRLFDRFNFDRETQHDLATFFLLRWS